LFRPPHAFGLAERYDVLALTRRLFLQTTAAGAAAAPQTAAPDATVAISLQELGPRIDPMLYGHFIEHLGGVIYDGVWVGPESRIPNVEGIRKSFIDDLKLIHAPVIRWPGGCFADGYHWRDGIGAPERRPRRFNFWQPNMPKGVDATDTNLFGTHEFMRLCELTGAQPYLAANVGSGSPEELYDWILYCNAPAGTVTEAQQRAANGHTAPFQVRFWGVGNESWGCGGNFKPEEYAAVYRRFVAQLPRYSEPFLIAAGPNAGDQNWTRGFFANIGKARVDGFALHYYTSTKSKADDFTPQQWYEVLSNGTRMEKLIEDHWRIMAETDKKHEVKLVVDEWGVWYPSGTEVKPGYLFNQRITLRDALHTAINLDIFNRHASKLAMANVAQTVNCLHSLFLAEGDRYTRTPVFAVYQMYMPHMGAQSLPVKIQSPEAGTGDYRLPGLSGSASVRNGEVLITLCNASLEADLNLDVRASGGTLREAGAEVLTHEDMHAANTFSAPEAVSRRPLPITFEASHLSLKAPRRSVMAITLRVI
jgi:alpha-L-arabinofuranosidase